MCSIDGPSHPPPPPITGVVRGHSYHHAKSQTEVSSLGEQDNKDKALDLGIAIESVLEVDQPDVSYKVRQRGTLLLGGTSDEKKDTFEHLKELYKLRSKVAHGSTLPPTVPVNGQQIATDQFFKRVLHHMCKDDSKNYRIGIRF
jgi:Apea-like HEPN